MLFNLEQDTGDRVIGYVVPDGFQGVPQIRICDAGEELLTIRANETREALVASSRHETGLCGFCIDSAIVPKLHERVNLELYDAESGLLIYRRREARMMAKKVLRLETHLFPLWQLDDALRPVFQYHARGIERFGRETVTQLFLLNSIDSVYLGGRILYKNYAYFVESSFKTTILLQDPYAELAERLMVLSKIRRVGMDFLGVRESMEVQSAAEFAEGLPYDDENALRRALRLMPRDLSIAFADPLTRQLTTTTPDEMPTGGALSIALDELASFALVGFRDQANEYLDALGELIGVERATLPPIKQFPAVPRLAGILKEGGQVDALLQNDLELYHHIREAAKKTKSLHLGY